MTIATIVAVLAPLLMSAIGFIFKTQSDKATLFFKLAVTLAAKAADAIAPATATTVDDKIAAFLDALSGAYADHGQTLTDADSTKAVALFQAMNGVK